MYRPLVTAIIEFSLGAYVYKKGKFQKNLISIFLVMLGSYQLGEFIMFASDGGQEGTNMAFFATTLLPPFGVMLVEKLTKENWGSVIFWLAGVVLALTFLLFDVKEFVEETSCFAKFMNTSNDWSEFTMAWSIYYLVGLTYVTFLSWYLSYSKEFRNVAASLKSITIAYITFYPLSFFLVWLFNLELQYVFSIMCGLAIFAAFIIARISFVQKDLN